MVADKPTRKALHVRLATLAPDRGVRRRPRRDGARRQRLRRRAGETDEGRDRHAVRGLGRPPRLRGGGAGRGPRGPRLLEGTTTFVTPGGRLRPPRGDLPPDRRRGV